MIALSDYFDPQSNPEHIYLTELGYVVGYPNPNENLSTEELVVLMQDEWREKLVEENLDNQHREVLEKLVAMSSASLLDRLRTFQREESADSDFL